MGRFNLFLTISTCSVAYHDKTWSVLFQKQVRYMFGSQTDFDLQSMSCIKVRAAQNLLLFSVTEQTHIFLTHCTPARLSWNSYIWYPTWREQRVLIKYSQNYNLFVFVFNSTEVRAETLTIFCVMIPLLVDTWPDFGLCFHRVTSLRFTEWSMGEGVLYNFIFTEWRHCVSQIFFTKFSRSMPNGYRKANFHFGPPPPSNRL